MINQVYQWVVFFQITHGYPEAEKASATAFKNADFSSDEVDHSDSHLSVSATDKCRFSISSFSTASFRSALHTVNRTGEILGSALNRFASLV